MPPLTLKKPAAILRNSYFYAAFDALGGLIDMRHTPRSMSLISGSGISYRVGPKVYDDVAFKVEAFRSDHHGVRSVLTSPHLTITRVFTRKPRHPLLTVALTIEPGENIALLEDVRLPRLNFVDDFASVIEGDDRDLYFDGAELGGGRQLPPWRVFFRKGHQRGLLLATRNKAMMSHIQIWPHTDKCIECRPHLMCNYSSDYTRFNAPMTLSPGERLRMTFELGPWQQGEHDRLLKAAKLDQPDQVTTPPAKRRRRPIQKAGTIFRAADIALPRSTGRGDQRDRWMLTSEAPTLCEPALFANSGYRPPMIKLDPKLKGLHRMHVGVGTAFRACVKLSGERHPRLRHLPANQLNILPWALQLGSQGKPSEIDFGVADMTGQTVRLGMPYSSQGHGTLDYIRFEPLNKTEAKAYVASRKRKPALALTGFADTYDIGYMWGDAAAPTTDPYRAVIAAHARAGFDRVFWRIDGECSDFPTKHGTLRPISCWAHNAYEPAAKAYSLMLLRNDLLRTAIDEGKRQGVAVWGWMRFNSYFSGARSDFFLDHPQYRDHAEGGNILDFRLSLAEPEVRQHKINILVEAASYGLPGINLGFLRHPPIICYPPALVDSYRKKYGCAPPRDLTPDYFQHLHTLPESTPEHRRWYRHRAEVMTTFGRELKEAMRAAGQGHVKISIWVRPNHCLFDGIDLDAWLDEGLCDEVVAGPYPGNPKLMVASAAWRRNVQSHVPLVGGIMPISEEGDFTRNRVMADVRRYRREGYDGLCTYECNDAVNMPQMLRLYDSLRGEGEIE